MPPSSPTADIERLQSSVTSLLALINHCRSSLSGLTSTTRPSTAPIATPPTPPSIPPLSLLHDTASLTKAHTTKLALLLTHSPLSSTCRAITPILSTIQTSVLPPLLTSVELLSTNHHGKALNHVVSRHISEILHGLEEMVGGPLKTLVDLALQHGASAGKEKPTSAEKDTIILPSTGKIWGSCDNLIALKVKGLNGVIKDRLQSSFETIKDAYGELTTYHKRHTPRSTTTDNADGSGEDSNEDDLDDGNDDPFWDTSDDFPTSPCQPKKKPYLLPPHTARTIDASITRLKVLAFLFDAISNNRLTPAHAPRPDPALTTSPNHDIVKRLDGMVDVTEEMVVLMDEVVGEYLETEFEDGDEEDKTGESGKLSDNEKSLLEKAITLTNLAELDWEGNIDLKSRLFEGFAKSIKQRISE